MTWETEEPISQFFFGLQSSCDEPLLLLLLLKLLLGSFAMEPAATLDKGGWHQLYTVFVRCFNKWIFPRDQYIFFWSDLIHVSMTILKQDWHFPDFNEFWFHCMKGGCTANCRWWQWPQKQYSTMDWSRRESYKEMGKNPAI